LRQRNAAIAGAASDSNHDSTPGAWGRPRATQEGESRSALPRRYWESAPLADSENTCHGTAFVRGHSRTLAQPRVLGSEPWRQDRPGMSMTTNRGSWPARIASPSGSNLPGRRTATNRGRGGVPCPGNLWDGRR
jgi:hypothetical protein